MGEAVEVEQAESAKGARDGSPFGWSTGHWQEGVRNSEGKLRNGRKEITTGKEALCGCWRTA